MDSNICCFEHMCPTKRVYKKGGWVNRCMKKGHDIPDTAPLVGWKFR